MASVDGNHVVPVKVVNVECGIKAIRGAGKAANILFNGL